MKIISNFDNLFLLEPELYRDNRGFFYEKYKKSVFDKIIKREISFKQDNISYSKKNVLRGLHFQSKPHYQEKLISVISGKIFDVVVNINPKSKNFKKCYSFILSSSNKHHLFIPSQYAHGFLTLTNNVVLNYKVTSEYDPKNEKTIIWSDKDLDIKWPITKISDLIISKKDREGKKIYNFKDL